MPQDFFAPVDYSNRDIFDDGRLLRERDLLKEEIRHEVDDFFSGLLDDHDHLRRIEDELVRRGLISAPSPVPFFTVTEA